MAETNATNKKALDMSSPYFLHPSDSPGAVITTCILNGENYDMWVKAMTNALRAKNKLGFIDGTLKKPAPDTPEAIGWSSCNSMLISWIFNSIEKSIQPSIAYEETAKAVWDDLRDRFSIGNAPRIHELKGQIASTRQHGMTVMAYYTRLKSMWDELGSYSRVPNCTCGAAHDFLREREEEKLHQFLMGLDDSVFGTVRSQILNIEPLPSVNKAYAMITKEERHRSIVRGQEDRPEVMAMAVSTTAKGRAAGQTWTKQQGDEKNCSHCHKRGHDITGCFELHGYPAWYKGRRGCERVEQPRGRSQAGRGQAYAAAVGGPVEGSSSAGIQVLSTEQF